MVVMVVVAVADATIDAVVDDYIVNSAGSAGGDDATNTFRTLFLVKQQTIIV